MVAIKEVVDTDDIVIVTSDGMVIRQHATDIRVAGRNTQGVRLIRLKEGDSIADVAAVVAEEEEEKQLAEKDKNSSNNKPLKTDTLSIDEKKGKEKEEVTAPNPDKSEKKKVAFVKNAEKKTTHKKPKGAK